MTDISIAYKTNQSTEKNIRDHLLCCDQEFSPPLSKRVNISEYARKIRERATTFEAWEGDGGALVGLVAVYMNTADRSCYITSVSVITGFLGRGIAAKLLVACLEQARDYGIATISLEVSNNNEPAIHLYQKYGFQVVTKHGNSIFMTNNLLPPICKGLPA